MNMLNSAKNFAMKNKEKIAAGVDKATDTIDKKTHGKYHDKLQKVDGATAKFAGKSKDASTTSASDPATPAADVATPAEPKPAADVKPAATDTADN